MVSPVPGPRSPVPVITIDGPSGVGKGTVARALARKLGWHFLDSGALYRILALAADRAGVPLDQAARVAALAQRSTVEFVEGPDGSERIIVDGADATAEVRAEATGNHASTIAVFPEVRAALLVRQRAFRRRPGLVADGRDMGTVVFPDATLKIFLDATPEERALRRLRQLSKTGLDANLSSLCAEIYARDRRDRTRAESPLRPAPDAVVIDTTRLTPDEVLAKVVTLAQSRGLAV